MPNMRRHVKTNTTKDGLSAMRCRCTAPHHRVLIIQGCTQLSAPSLRPAITTRIAVYNASATCDIISECGNLHIDACHRLSRCLPALFSRISAPTVSQHTRACLLVLLLMRVGDIPTTRNDCFWHNNNQLGTRYTIHLPHTL